jgi:glycosyltransferase involved in cell wall biosynthesis
MKKISLCTIVKNEEDFIRIFIENAKDFVDEIIVVDIGSFDRSIKYAEELGASVYSFDWNTNPSFAQAKNFAIEKSTGDYVLILDVDEKLMSENKNILKEYINSLEDVQFKIYSFPQYIYANEERIAGFQYKHVMFPKNSGLKFEKDLHEIIVTEKKDEIPEVEIFDKIKILNYGNIHSLDRNIRKTQDYFENIFLCAEKYPEDLHYQYYLAIFYYSSSDLQKAVELTNRALKIKYNENLLSEELFKMYISDLYKNLLSAYLFNGFYQDIFNARYEIQKHKIENNSFIFMYLGIASYKLSLFDFAIEYLQKSLDIIQKDESQLKVSFGNKNQKVKIEYYLALSKNEKEGKRLINEESILTSYLANNSDDNEIKNILANLYLKAGKISEGIKYLGISSKDKILNLANNALTTKEDNKIIAQNIIDFYHTNFGENIESLKIQANIYLAAHDYFRAKTLILKILESEKDIDLIDIFLEVLKRGFPHEVDFYRKKFDIKT